MKVYINTLPLRSGHKFRGVGFYTQNLLNGLKNFPDLNIQEFSDISEIKEPGIVHYPFFDPFKRSLPFKTRFPTVVTIHDVIPLIFPQHYPSGVRGMLNLSWQRLVLKNVSAVITDSENSKKDVYKYLGVDIKKIQVVYLAPSGHLINDNNIDVSTVRRKYNLPDVFALYVGDVNWNKNLSGMAQACIDAGINLVLVGKGFEREEDLDHPELASLKEFLRNFSENPKVQLLGFVPDSELTQIYKLSKVVLLVSFYEGFGLTILEAQSLGVPVISSNVSSVPEIAREGAILVNPYATGDIKDALEAVINKQNLRDQMIRDGLKNVKRFSWKKTVEQTVEVYKKVV